MEIAIESSTATAGGAHLKLSRVIPWGRSFAEYRAMFSLSEEELSLRILGCADGPASFNAEAARLGATVVSSDPIYHFSVDELRQRIQDVYPQIMAKMKAEPDQYLWTSLRSVEHLGEVRMKAMAAFIQDFELGFQSGRYVPAALPDLPFDEAEFDLALCSHYLFLYSDLVDAATHLASILELCRVASEVRIFPVVSLDGTVSQHLGPVTSGLRARGMHVSLQPVTYRFQKGATEMLLIRPRGVLSRTEKSASPRCE